MSASTHLVFDYLSQPLEPVLACDLCAGDEFLTVACEDRYGLPVTAVECSTCALVFLNPRMTREGYERFYESVYRPLVSAYHGRDINAHTIQAEQRAYAEELTQFLRHIPALGKHRVNHLLGVQTILDVGGSTGIVARQMEHLFRAKATVLDPSAEELAQADGLEVICSLVEDFGPGDRKWDLTLLCQTVDHLLDISSTLRKLSGCSRFLFVDILDYEQTKTIKVDHPYNLTRETMEAYFSMTGWKVLQSADTSNKHVAYLCERSL